MLIDRLIHYNPYHLTLAKDSFEKIYRIKQDAKTKERMLLLVLDVAYHGKVAAKVARDLHRSKTRDCEWLKRYDEEDIKGLRDRTKSVWPTEISEEITCQIKKELKESSYGRWTTKQIEELIVKKSGIKYHYIHIYRHILRE